MTELPYPPADYTELAYFPVLPEDSVPAEVKQSVPYTGSMRTEIERADRAARAAAGRGAWRDLVGGDDLVAELLAERRAEAKTQESSPAPRRRRWLSVAGRATSRTRR